MRRCVAKGMIATGVNEELDELQFHFRERILEGIEARESERTGITLFFNNVLVTILSSKYAQRQSSRRVD
jgi:hypothetical protein